MPEGHVQNSVVLSDQALKNLIDAPSELGQFRDPKCLSVTPPEWEDSGPNVAELTRAPESPKLPRGLKSGPVPQWTSELPNTVKLGLARLPNSSVLLILSMKNSAIQKATVPFLLNLLMPASIPLFL